MSRSSDALETLAPVARRALVSLGENLRIARERRGESLRTWALRMEVSVPTIRRMEAGDPTVGMGVYATALWLVNQDQALAALARPEDDFGAMEMDIIRSSRRRKRNKAEPNPTN